MNLLETIKCRDEKLYNLEFHQARLNVARMKFFPNYEKLKLEDIITIPEEYKSGLFRCRVVYSETIEKIEFIPYESREIKCLKMVEDNNIQYHCKYSDRTHLQQLFEQKGNCDDILIVKNGCITDSFTANTIFFDGEKWWTPDTPLLPGTQRARLLADGKISVCRITKDDMHKYQKIGLINAMLDMDDMPVLEVDKIITCNDNSMEQPLESNSVLQEVCY